MDTPSCRFPKREHLCLRSEIEQLFSAGSHALTAWPVRMVYRVFPPQASPAADTLSEWPDPRPEGGRGPRVKVMLSVAKRRLRHAVDRNRAKRQLREAYRLARDRELLARLPEGYRLHLAFVLLAQQPQPSEAIAQSVGQLLRRLADKVSQPPER